MILNILDRPDKFQNKKVFKLKYILEKYTSVCKHTYIYTYV